MSFNTMRLDQALVHRGLCDSRTEAQELIASRCVLVNGNIIIKQTLTTKDEDILHVTRRRKFVSRGGEKLEGALLHIFGTQDALRSHFCGKTAIDIGSSTGGFTDCLLSYAVASVTAVDVGTSQLHSKLRDDTRVIIFENTDIRDYTPHTLFEIVVADLSFIPLERVIDNVLAFGDKGAEYFLLIKPQFEVGKGNTKKGIVKSVELRAEVLEKYTRLVEDKGLRQVSVFPCVITGGDGNQEYFLYAKK